MEAGIMGRLAKRLKRVRLGGMLERLRKRAARDPEIEQIAIEKKKEALKAEDEIEELEEKGTSLEFLAPRLKAGLGFLKSWGFFIVAVVFSAPIIGFVLGQRFPGIYAYVLVGIAASAVIYRAYSRLKKDRDAILEERDRAKILEDRSRVLLENALDCIFTLDLEGRITSFNKKAEQVTGYSKKDVLGNSLGMFLPPEGIKDFFDKLHQAVSTGVVPRYELDVNTIYGKRNFEMGLTAIKNRDMVVGVQGIARDITDRKRLEKELNMTSSKLERWSKRTVKKEMTILEMKNQLKALKKELETHGGENS